MLDTELVTLDSDAVRCNISGFLPLHAVTANRLTDMYNWLTDRRGDAAPLEPGRNPLICRAADPACSPCALSALPSAPDAAVAAILAQRAEGEASECHVEGALLCYSLYATSDPSTRS